MAEVKFSEIRKSFGDHEVISGVDLEIHDGELVVLVGPSGSGKSTMLRIVAGLEEVTSGVITINGRELTHVSPAERGIAMVFQSYALYPHMSAYENIAFNLRLNKLSKDEVDRRVRSAARILKITDYLERKPSQLSGGQRQRVAIGRAIVRNPEVFLFDEPLSNLDAALRVEMRLEIETLHRCLGATMIYVTHDQTEAMTLADRIVAFDAGRIQQIGRPMELYNKPSNLFVALFIGSPKMNFLSATVAENGWARLDLPEQPCMSLQDRPLAQGDRVTVGVRPEALTIDAGPGDVVLHGEVATCEQLGHISYTHVSVGTDQSLVIQTGADVPFARKQKVTVKANASDFHVFDERGLAVAA